MDSLDILLLLVGFLIVISCNAVSSNIIDGLVFGDEGSSNITSSFRHNLRSLFSSNYNNDIDNGHLISDPIPMFPNAIQQEKGDKQGCITYSESESLISVTCEYATFSDILGQIKDNNIIGLERASTDKIYLLAAGINVEQGATLDINANDIKWLKIIPSETNHNAIIVNGRLKVDSVKITSWNPETNDYVKFPKEAKNKEEIYASILRPYITINSDATGPTIIRNSELAYLGYDCGGGKCGGITFNGGKYSILKNNDIHHIFKGFYSKGMGYMLIEGNRVYENDMYGIDPHTGTHHMIIRNNTVYDNGLIGIICSLDCYNIIIEGNEVYNHPSTGIMFSRNMYDSIARNNYVHDEKKCIDVSESHENQVYNNKISNCRDGIRTTKNSFNNDIFDNEIKGVSYGLKAEKGSDNNRFHSNTIADVQIEAFIQDSESTGNIFENNEIVAFDTLQTESRKS